MANTTFEDIYARYRIRVSDYNYAELDDFVIQSQQHDLLMAAIDDFSDIAVNDITDYDDETEQWNIELSKQEQKILSMGMICHWLEAYVYNSDALQNALSTKDFTFYSPANLLREMTELLKQTRKKLRAEMNLYSFKMGSCASLNE